MHRVRFYMEDPGSLEGQQELYSVLSNWFKDYTLYRTDGFLEGVREDSLVIEVIGNYDKAYCDDFAYRLKFILDQDAVMYTREFVEVTTR